MARLTLRHITSIILLATYLPMVVFSSLHEHHDTVDVRDDCMQCAGHYETSHHHQHDCLFCNFLSLQYKGQTAVQAKAALPPTAMRHTECTQPVATLSHGVSLLRAPPAS